MLKKILNWDMHLTIYKMIFLIVSLGYTLPIPYINTASVMGVRFLLVWGLLLLILFVYQGKVKLDNKFYFLFLIFVFFSIIFNFDKGISRNLKDFLYLILEVMVLSNVHGRNKLKTLGEINNIVLVLMTFGYIVSLYIFLFQIVWIKGLHYTFAFMEGRLWSWCGNPNTFAYMAIIGVIAALLNLEIYKDTKYYKYLKPLYISIIIIAVMCLSLTSSRAGTIGFVILVALLSLRTYSMNKKNILKRLFLGFIACLISLVGLIGIREGLKMVPPMISTPQTNIPESSVKVDREIGSDYSNGRFAIWKGGLLTFKSNPLFGVGQDGLSQEVNKFMPADLLKRTPKITANLHNVYLQVLVTSGVFAFVFFLIMFGMSFIKRLKVICSNKIISILAAFVFVFLLMNAFDSIVISFMNLFLCGVFWIYLGYLLYLDNEDKKKVTFLINNLDTGGAETVLTNLLKYINREKFSICVKTIFNEGALVQSLDSSIQYKSIIKRPNKYKIGLMWRYINKMPRFILRFLIIGDEDILVSFLEGMCTKIVGSTNDERTCFSWVHTDLNKNRINEKNYSNRKQALKCYERMSAVICVSEDCAQQFTAVYPELDKKVKVIHNGLDVVNIKTLSLEKVQLPFNLGEEDILFCSVGRLVDEKGFTRLIQAYKELDNNQYHFKALIIGDGVLKQKLKDLIVELELTENIFLLGKKENPYPYMKMSDYFILSSKVEGFSLVVMEALILDTMVISTDCTGPKEILSGGCGILCDNSYHGIYHALENCFEERQMDINHDLVKKKIIEYDIHNKVKEVERLFGEQYV